MLNMKVLDYRITSDARQVIVSRAKRNDQGELYSLTNSKGVTEEAQSVVGYYGNLSKALVAIQRDHILGGAKELTTVKEYREELENITRACEDALDLYEEI